MSDHFQCPVCRKPLTRQEYESALGIYQARQEELARREEDLEKERGRLILQARQARERGIEEGRKAEKKRAEQALAEQREAVERQARQLQKREAAFRRQKDELVEKAKAALAKGIEQGIQSEKKRAERLVAGQADTIARLQEKIRQLESGTTPQTEGLEFEETLVARLQDEFPTDDIVIR